MPLVRFDKQEITFSFKEADRLMAYMEQVGNYAGHKSTKSAFNVMEDYGVLETFIKLREIVKMEYDD